MVYIRDDNILFKIKSINKLIIKKLSYGNSIETFKVTPTQIEIIEYILNSDSKVYQRDLEKILNLSRATVSGVLITMEKNRLIKRVADENDLRSKQIILNKVAKQEFLKTKEKIIALSKIINKDITLEELEIFSRVIDKMKNNINKYNK